MKNKYALWGFVLSLVGIILYLISTLGFQDPPGLIASFKVIFSGIGMSIIVHAILLSWIGAIISLISLVKIFRKRLDNGLILSIISLILAILPIYTSFEFFYGLFTFDIPFF